MRISDWSSDVCSSDLLKLSLGNPVTIPAHDGAVKPFARLLISRQIGVTQHHVNKASMLIRNMQAHHTGTVIGNRRYHFAVGQRIQFDGLTPHFRLEYIGRAPSTERVCQYV